MWAGGTGPACFRICFKSLVLRWCPVDVRPGPGVIVDKPRMPMNNPDSPTANRITALFS